MDAGPADHRYGLTGLEIHGTWKIFGYDLAAKIHDISAYTLLILVGLGIFWQSTTGERKQYLPTGEKLSTMLRYYTVGIFKNEPAPYKKTELSRLNPLQRFTYLVLKLFLVPLQVVTGVLYLNYNR